MSLTGRCGERSTWARSAATDPCGIGLLVARTWVVAGYEGDLFAFGRGDHARRRYLWIDVDLAGHSHLLAV